MYYIYKKNGSVNSPNCKEYVCYSENDFDNLVCDVHDGIENCSPCSICFVYPNSYYMLSDSGEWVEYVKQNNSSGGDNACSVEQTVTSGTEIGKVNGTALYAPTVNDITHISYIGSNTTQQDTLYTWLATGNSVAVLYNAMSDKALYSGESMHAPVIITKGGIDRGTVQATAIDADGKIIRISCNLMHGSITGTLVSAPMTDTDVNNLIDARIGVIENGTY